MKILFIRHGDPDYKNDTLTVKGIREAQLLAKRMNKIEVDDFYVSPLGRAKDTASYTLHMQNRTAKTLDFLREFPAELDVNHSKKLQSAFTGLRKEGDTFAPRILWDMLPSYLATEPAYMDANGWRDTEAVRNSDMIQIYDQVILSFDQWLETYGYKRNGYCYQVEKESTKTVAVYCHFGIICVLLSHLWNMSPFSLWHSFALAPSSLTELVTEEREQGIAYFRALRVGDLSHLDAGDEKPSFAARFCEVYSNKHERH